MVRFDISGSDGRIGDEEKPKESKWLREMGNNALNASLMTCCASKTSRMVRLGIRVGVEEGSGLELVVVVVVVEAAKVV